MILNWIPDDVFPCWIQSGVKFYFCPKSFLSIQRVFEFKVKQLPVPKATISHLVSTLVCSFVLHMLKTDSYCSFQKKLLRASKSKLSYRRHMSCLITEKLEAIPNGQPLPAQRASDDVKLCTFQIRTSAGEGEHVLASGRLVVWRNKESALANVKESRVCRFSENLCITSDSVVRIRIATKSRHALIVMKIEMFYSGVHLAW